MLVKLALTFPLFILLSNCGPAATRIDASSASVLEQTLIQLSADLSPEERITFGQDISLLFSLRQSGNDSHLSFSDLYQEGSVRIFESHEPFEINYQNIQEAAGPIIHQLTVEEVNDVANTVRRQVLLDYLIELVRQETWLLTSLDSLKNSLSSTQGYGELTIGAHNQYESSYDQCLTRIEYYENQADQYAIHIQGVINSIVSSTPNKQEEVILPEPILSKCIF